MDRASRFLLAAAALAAFCLLSVSPSVRSVGAQTATIQPVVERYSTDAAAAVYRSGIAVVDTPDLTNAPTATAIQTISQLDGKTTVRISPRFSNSGATGTLVFVRGALVNGAWTPYGKTEVPVVASTTLTISSLYPADDVVFDAGGAPSAKVYLTTLSAGTATLFRVRQ